MKREHLGAFLWLFWRLRRNQWRRSGVANQVILVLLATAMLLAASGLFVGLFLVGLLVLAEARPIALLATWDGVVVVFLVFWLMGLLADLQRAEVLSLDKFLHLPVPLTSAFLINYLGLLLGPTFLLFMAAALGLCLGLVLGRGPAMLLLLPLLAAFLLMVTALTYQFQGWLASLMANKRRRRAIIVLLGMTFLLLAQLPNVINMLSFSSGPDEQTVALAAKRADLDRARTAGRMTFAEYQQRWAKVQSDYQAEKEKASRQKLQQVEQLARLANLVLPPGWLPLGAEAAAEGQVLPALLGTLGLALLGTASLWRSYRTTLRLYLGQLTAGSRRQAAGAPQARVETPPTSGLLDKQIPWVSEPVAAIALATLRSLLRAPEVRMMLLGPMVMLVVFGGMFWRGASDLPDDLRPLVTFGAMAFILTMLVQLVGNQFGLDRGGFQVFVLSGVQRRDVLLGKNLACAPLALGLCLVAVAALQAILPMPLDRLLIVPPQLLSMYLLFCLLANGLSILGPVRVRAGSFRAASPGGVTLLLHLGFLLLFPLLMLPTLLPLAIQLALEARGWDAGVPVGFVLSLLECVGVAYLYRAMLNWQGQLLQDREQAVLTIVRTKEE